MKVLLIDASHIMGTIYSAASSDGEVIIDDFFASAHASIRRAIRDHKPTHLLVAFDDFENSWRRDLIPGYRRGRGVLPLYIENKISDFIAYISEYNIKGIQLPRMDSKDIIGTICSKLDGNKKIDVTILGAGKRFYPMIGKNIKLCSHFPRYNKDDAKDYEWLSSETGLTKEQWSVALTLAGATSSGVPGIPGIGEKTAEKIAIDFIDIDDLRANAFGIDGKKGEVIRKNIDEAIEYSGKVMGFNSSIELGFSLRDFKYSSTGGF